MNKIAIFCSASDHIDPIYAEKASELGAWIGKTGKWLIYGGSNTASNPQLSSSASFLRLNVLSSLN